MRILLTIVFGMMASLLFAQKDTINKGSIIGIVKDSADDFTLQSVTVTLFNASDSSVLNYQITNNDGAFTFTDIPYYTPVNINFSFTGYLPFSKTIRLDTLNRNYNFKNVLLVRSMGVMDEVIVKAVVPVTMNGDTLEINPGAFKLDSNAVVEDMLRRVPGITMWGDGAITVNGKKVNNVYVDGKPFFGDEPTLATQNLPKNAIEKIQVYQETDYSKDNIDDNPADSMLTMNIKLREDKKFGFFGKMGAGIGTDDRYEADALGLAFNKKTRGGIAASLNNINKTAGLQEMFKQNTYKNYKPGNSFVANFDGNGISKVLFLGGNVQYDLSQNNNSHYNDQVQANYDFRKTDNFANSTTDSRSSLAGQTLLQNSKQISTSISNTHNGRIGYNKRDQDKDFSLSASFNSTDSKKKSGSFATQQQEGASLISESTRTTTLQSKSNTVSLSTSFKNKDDDERNLKSFGINYNLSYNNGNNESSSISNIISYKEGSKNEYYNRLNNSNNTNFNTSLGANYNALKRLLFGNFSLWDINLVIGNNLSFSKSDANIHVSDYDSATAKYFNNDFLTNDNRVTKIDERPSLRISKNFVKRLSDRFNRYINITANIQEQFLSEKNESSISYRNLDRSFRFFTPSASVAYTYQKYNAFNIEMALSGSSGSSIPTINQLRPIIDTSANVYNISLGNPNLQPTTNKSLNFTFNYRRQQPTKKTDYNFVISGGANLWNNAITDSSIYNLENGRRTIYLINMDGRRSYNTSFKGGISFKMKNNNVLQMNYSANYSNTTAPNYVNTIYTITKSNNLNNKFDVFYSLGDYGTVQVSQAINTDNSTQSTAALQSLKTINYITQGNLNINPLKNLTIGNTIDYVKNSTNGQSSTLWNAFATYRFLKAGQAEVKLSAMDILNKNKNISTSVSNNGNLSTTVSNGLQQFFMVTFSYYPRRFGASGKGARKELRRLEGGNKPESEGFKRREQGGGFRGGGNGKRNK